MSDRRFLVACDGDRGVASMLIETDKPFLSNKDKADFLRRHAGYVFRIVDGEEMTRLMAPQVQP
jgi:hypothetical protein